MKQRRYVMNDTTYDEEGEILVETKITIFLHKAELKGQYYIKNKFEESTREMTQEECLKYLSG